MRSQDFHPVAQQHEITPENVAGLVVGEGSFYCESKPDPKYRLGWRIRPAFCVEMRADERVALEAIKTHLRCGRIYDLDFGRYKGYEERGWFPHSKFRVTRLDDLATKVIPFFDQHRLFGRKAIAYELWRELVLLVSDGDHRSPVGLDYVREIAGQLALHNQRGV